ncbi:MAG: peroxide stress protein YaaA [Burkholderiaceae bacterium]|nr:peroxide stress protein YaaA [Burkholderiaceae bacterium]
MLFLLSPAKSLNYESTAEPGLAVTPPVFEGAQGPAAELMGLLRQKSPQEIAGLMRLSDKLAALNVARYALWAPKGTAANARAAALAFDGDVYGGLDAQTFTSAQWAWAQAHLVILSGLYGVLRPLDRLQPYRLEMGTRLPNRHGKDLYAFWQARIAQYLNQRMAGEPAAVLVNLASQEYFKAVDLAALESRIRVVECVFEEYRGNRYKIIGLHAKRARGLMARWAVFHQTATPEALASFDLEGYAFDAAVSRADRMVFRRRQ